MDRLLYFVFVGSRGGPTRARIVQALLQAPLNTHQLAQKLRLDYKTVEYNLRVLHKHRYATPAAEQGYGVPWSPSKNLWAARVEFEDVLAQLQPPAVAATGSPDLGKPTNNAPDGEGAR